MSVRPAWAVEFSPTTGPFDDSPSWEAITSRVRGISTTRGRQQELDVMQPGTAAVVVDNNDRELDPNNAAGSYYGDLLPAKRVRIRATYGAEGLDLPGGTGDYASAPDAGWTPGEEVDLFAKVALDDWTPTVAGIIFGQTNASFSDAAIAWGITTDGRLSLTWFETGTGTPTTVTSDVLGFDDGSTHYLRTTLDVDNGVGSYEVKFYETTDDGGTWEQIGSTATGPATGVPRNSTSAFTLGGLPAAGYELAGRIFLFKFSPTIGDDPVGRIRFTDGQACQGGASTATGTYGTVWTVQGSASFPARVRDVFGGFAEGWPVPARTLGRAAVSLVDGFALLADAAATDDLPLAGVLKSLRPAHYYKLTDAAGSAVVTDSGSDPVDGVPNGYAADGLGGTDTGFFDGESALVNPDEGLVDIGGAAWSTAVLLFKSGDRSTGSANNPSAMLLTDDVAGLSIKILGWGSLGGSTGAIEVSDTTSSYVTTDTFDDDVAHLLVVRHIGAGSWSVSVDGVAQTLTSTGIRFHPTPATSKARLGRGLVPSNGYHFLGTLGHVAVFEEILTAGQVTAVIEAAAEWSGDTVDQRLGRILDLSGWSSSERDLDASEVGSLGVGEFGSDVLADARTLERTENGAFYQRADYVMRFRSRYATVTDPRSTAVRYTFTDAPGPERFRFDDVELPSQGEWIRNRVSVSWVGGSVTVEDPASIDAYGAREHTVDTLLTTAAQARSPAELILARYAEPVPRVSSLSLDLGAEPRGWEPALDLEIGDRVRVVWTPGDVGDPVEVEALVDGIKIEAGDGLAARATLRLSGADDLDLWTWGVSTWGETTRWA